MRPDLNSNTITIQMAKTVKAAKKSDKNKNRVKKKRTLLKTYLFQKDIIQSDIRTSSGLSGGCVSKLVSKGTANKSTKKLVAGFLGLTDSEFEKLLEFEK